MRKIVIFASGSGSNAEKIILHFKNSNLGLVSAVFSNKPDAKVLEKSQNLGISTVVFDKNALSDGTVLAKIKAIDPDLIVLAGFLWKFPESIIEQYPGKIINIHPALLPKYGGKGMYGMNVHRAILENGEKETGITIHYVNEHYDEGGIVFQATVSVADCTTPEAIAAKVQELEHEHFPIVIENLLKA
ncbi:phosphoribosylglycinamide formyltransferase [Flavobacterium supellecticarium]|uniref:Phosphoribosylglycinamide formyltransferase n=1 Tax=Flavobacterium supellecticarium TaxID=2565924 RepID=A0A4S3ZUY8_9FLAO|nr:phosphoribosylglycinamide formyltransferase [Flavobacterium supellecticarium]THF49465.1 phosphoribosylglycinamide formyltransferase [Flavobacterium supellecticarium]